MEALLFVWLAAATVLQWSWLVVYAVSYRWRETALGPVWLAKGAALAGLWPTLILNEVAPVPVWVWSLIFGPAITATTAAWLIVTVRVRGSGRRAERPDL